MSRPTDLRDPALQVSSSAEDRRSPDVDPYHIQALERGLDVLRAFRADRQVMDDAELARRTGLPRKTVERLTFTLEKLGYLKLVRGSRQYEVAAGVLGLAQTFLARQPVSAIARDPMLRLAHEVRRNVALGIHEGSDVYILEYAVTDTTGDRRLDVGFRLPLARSALGAACAAALPQRAWARLLEDIKARYPADWKTYWEGLDAARSQYASDGYCVAIGTLYPGTAAVAVPFADPTSNETMALGVIAPANRLDRAQMGGIGHRLRELAAELHDRLLPRPPVRREGSELPASRFPNT